MEGQNNILNSWAAAKQLDDYVILHPFELISGDISRGVVARLTNEKILDLRSV
jgi:hypothetical protein